MILPHAKKRLSQRYGINLTRSKHKKIVHDIQAGKARNPEKQSCTRTKWEVKIKDQWIPIIYSNLHKKVVTALSQVEA